MCRRLFHFEVPLNVALVLILLLPLYSIAQDSAQVSNDVHLRRMTAVSLLTPGRLIRIRALKSNEIIARYLSSNSDSLFVNIESNRSGVSISSINVLWERGHATKSGIMIGSLSLGAVGLGLGMALSSAWKGSEMCGGDDCTNVVVATGLGGAVLGGLLGAVVGAVTTKWHERFNADDSSAYRKGRRPGRFSFDPGIYKGGMHMSASLAF